MPTWSYLDFQIIRGDDDDKKAFSEMLENESPFYMCEGGDGSWTTTIRSGTGCDFVEEASRKFKGLRFQVQEYSDDMDYYRSYKWEDGKCPYWDDARDFCSEVPAKIVKECVDDMENLVRDNPDDEEFKEVGLTKLYGLLENEQPTTADIRSIFAKNFLEIFTLWCQECGNFEKTHRDMFMDDLREKLLELFLQKAKEMAKKKLASIFSSVVVLKRFVRSYVEYSNAPGGYAFNQALERFENLAEETKVAGKVHGEVNEKTAAADKSSKLNPVVVDGSVSWQAEEPSSSLSSPKKSSSTEAARAAKKKKSLQHVNVNVLPSLAAAKNKAPPPAAPSARKAVLPSAPSVKMVVSPSAKKPVTPHAVTAATPPLSSVAAVSTSTPFPLRDVLRRNVQLQSLSSAAGSQFPVSPSTTGVVPTPPTIRQAVKVRVHVDE